MEKPNKNSKKLIVPIAVVILIVLSIFIVLSNNKKKINEAAQPVDRTDIPVAVTTAPVVSGLLEVNEQYPATVQPQDEAMVYAQTSGMISNLGIHLGKHVNKGQVIGELDTRILEINLKNAQIDLQSAAINKAKKMDDYNRAKDLYDNKAGLEVNMLTAKNDYDNAANKYNNTQVQIDLIRQQIANSNIIAPLGGIISAHQVKQGEFVNPGTAIATISNIATVKATVFVDQQMSYRLKTGEAATITSPVFDGQSVTGKIVFISPVSDANHNYQVDLLVTNEKNLSLKGGTDVQVTFNTLAKKDVLQIPKSAVMNDAREPYVFVAENGKAMVRTISTGVIINDIVEVISGLKAGETVITAGQINLREGSKIKTVK